jgi:hypothetical protein
VYWTFQVLALATLRFFVGLCIISLRVLLLYPKPFHNLLLQNSYCHVYGWL